ncbi:hypothetical protein Trydic_g7386 [Trypoxylus dichotomus]
MDTIVAGLSNLSTPEPGRGDGTGSAVDSPRLIGTAHTITDLLESQMVDLLHTPPSEGSDSRPDYCKNPMDAQQRDERPFIGTSLPPTSEVKTLISYAEAHKLQLDAMPTRTTLSGAAHTPINEVSHLSVTSSQTWKNCNWDAYRELLIEELERCHRRIKIAVDIELLAESLLSATITSYEASCLVKIRSTNRDTPWWPRELSEQRTATRKLCNKCKKSGSWDPDRTQSRLKKAKRPSWKKVSRELEAVPECSRIRKVLTRERPSRIGTLSKSDGTKAETEEQVLQHLLEIPDSRAWRVDWNLARKIIQVSFKPFKSAGRDGIFPALLQQGQDLLSPILCTLLRATLAVGHLPSSWREARVVSIPKQGKTSYTARSKIVPAHQPYLIPSQNLREDYC